MRMMLATMPPRLNMRFTDVPLIGFLADYYSAGCPAPA